VRTTGSASLAVAGLLFGSLAHAAEVRIPAIGQPSPFYGAAGTGVAISATADPTHLHLDDWLVYTLRIEKLANAADVRRPDLNAINEFASAFQIEDAATPIEPKGARLFRYRLRPRRSDVTSIPAFTFPYYDPNIAQPPDQPGFPFRRARTEPIPIVVTKKTTPPLPPMPVEVPAFAESPATSAPVHVPAWAWWLAAALPPMVALGGCAAWRALNPAGARLARRRRSRAARAALRALHSFDRHPPVDPAAVVWCVSGYLAERFDLPGVFRTPGDLAGRLREAGADPATVSECQAFLHAADVARFAPRPDVTGEALIADAERLVRRLEGEG
jgi:hypothetical protein